MRISHLYTFLAVSAATLALGTRHARGNDEFVGPLAGWKNVKTDYAGDGKTDDTPASRRPPRRALRTCGSAA
jgi:hypothetical protein